MPPKKRTTFNSVSRLGSREHGAETGSKSTPQNRSQVAPTSYRATISHADQGRQIALSSKKPRDPRQVKRPLQNPIQQSESELQHLPNQSRRPRTPPPTTKVASSMTIDSEDDYDDFQASYFQSDEDDNPLNPTDDSYDDEPQYKMRRVEFSTYNPSDQKNPHRWCPDTTNNYPLPEKNVRRLHSINFPSFPSMTMPEFTIDKDIKHFIYDMTAYLRYQVQLSEQERAHLILVGVKGTAKDVIMGYAEDETDSTEKVFQILRQEFKRHDKCAAGLYGIKQEVEEKISIFGGKIRKYVRGLGVRTEKFDQACIDFLKLGCLPHIKTRLIQLHPRTFQRALKIASEAESENAKVIKNKTISHIEVVDTPEISIIDTKWNAYAL